MKMSKAIQQNPFFHFSSTNQKTGMDITVDENRVSAYRQSKGTDITSDASKFFNSFDCNIILSLSDHIAFAIKRIKEGLIITNPFKDDIRLLFEEEYNITLKSVGYINDRFNIAINDDEISYITLHIHGARSDMKISESILMATVINESLK